jgi:hypothetical protein
MIPNNFIAAQQVNFEATMKNDCLTFNINQLLRHYFFVTREQVMRLWKHTSQKGDKELNRRKVNQGVSDTAFRDFFVKSVTVVYKFYKSINMILPILIILALAFVMNWIRNRKYARKR